MREWRRRKEEKEIDPTQLTRAEGEKAFCPHWAKGAVDALHEASENYLVGMMEDANLLAIHAKRFLFCTQVGWAQIQARWVGNRGDDFK